MKKRNYTLTLAMILIFFFAWLKPAQAVDIQLQPRLETGVAFYAIKIDALSEAIPATSDAASARNLTQQKIELKDSMAFVGGGTTLFINRLFIDLGLQYSFDGKDSTSASWSMYVEDNGDGSSYFESADIDYQSDFSRQDVAISLGYAITKHLSIYVGYKWSELDLELIFDGPYSLLSIDNYVAHGRQAGEEHLKFKYEGPFAGVTHGWQVEWASKYLGLFSVNIGLANLHCKLIEDQSGKIRIESLNGIEIDPIENSYSFTKEETGKALGVTLAVGWRGVTPINNLTYSLGFSAYRYQFDLDDAEYEVSESSVVCKVGLSYSF